jgi:hypothetical protein
MKIRLLSATLMCALVALPIARAQDKDKDQTELGSKMEKASGAWRSAKKNLDKPDMKDDVLAKLQTMKDNFEAAAKLEPAKKADIPADQQAKFVAAYHDAMKDEIARVDKLIAAVKSGASADQLKAMAADIDKGQKEGHTEFRKKKKDK